MNIIPYNSEPWEGEPEKVKKFVIGPRPEFSHSIYHAHYSIRLLYRALVLYKNSDETNEIPKFKEVGEILGIPWGTIKDWKRKMDKDQGVWAEIDSM